MTEKYIPQFTWEAYEDPYQKMIDSISPEDIYESGVHMPMSVLDGIPFGGSISKIWNLWILHTPIKLTRNTCEFILSLPGVEKISKLSEHRCAICFSKAFYPTINEENAEERLAATFELREMVVQKLKELDKTVNYQPKNQQQKDTAHSIETQLKSKFWAYGILNNEKVLVVQADEKNEEFQREVDILKETIRGTGGVFKRSW